MNDMGLDPIHQFPGGLDSNGDAHKPKPEPENLAKVEGSEVGRSSNSVSISKSRKNGGNSVIVRRERPTRACTARPPKYVDPPAVERRSRPLKKEKVEVVEDEGSSNNEKNEVNGKCSEVVTLLVKPPTIEQMPRWNLRSMWELASILNFLHVFRPLLNITVEFSADELESALLTPNGILGEVHIPLLKSIPPVARMACGLDTWVTVLCRKLRDWWHWVAEGELPIVSSQGAETEAYKNLDPEVRVVILKALCDIRVEQDDIRSYIDNSVKHGIQLSAFRKPCIGGDSHGISYWYEDDELIGHRLYRNIRKVERIVELKKGKIKGSHVLSSTTYEWETVATNLDEFLYVSEKLFASKNRTEVLLGKKLKNDLLPEIEKIHKRKEQLLKKQHRQALLLDSFVTMDGLAVGRSRRDRKPVTYTFDDFDHSICEALKVTKDKQQFPEPGMRRDVTKSESCANGRWNGSSHDSMPVSFSPLSPAEYDEMDEDRKSELPDRSSRRLQKPQRYSENDFVGAESDEEYVVSDDDIVGEAVYPGETDLKQRKQKRKVTSGSEGEADEEYHWSDENEEDDLEEEEDSISGSEDSDQPSGRINRREGRASRGTMLQSDSSLRRSTRSTRTQIDYQQYEYSDSETESLKRKRTNPSETGSQDSDEVDVEEHQEDYFGQSQDSDESNEEEPRKRGFDQTSPSPSQDELDDIAGERRFLDLNELAPGTSFDDGPGALVKDNDGKSE